MLDRRQSFAVELDDVSVRQIDVNAIKTRFEIFSNVIHDVETIIEHAKDFSLAQEIIELFDMLFVSAALGVF